VLAARHGVSKQRVSKIARQAPAPEIALTPGLCRHRRRAAGLTQEQLAAATGLHAASIGFYERGRCAMRPGNLARIVAALGPPAEPPVLTPALCRAARGLLDWTQKDLADAVGVSVTTLTGYERHGAMMTAGLFQRVSWPIFSVAREDEGDYRAVISLACTRDPVQWEARWQR
jgi:transcriptional regulator with XRE-family HTH domain